MVFSKIMQRFMEKAPIPVMAQTLLERVLTPERLNECFDRVTEKQYTRELLFSSVFGLMVQVVTKVFPSINAAYQAEKEDIGTSITAVYEKLNGLETAVPAALVKDTSTEFSGIVDKLKGSCKPLLPGYRVKMLDGNCIEASEHRLKVLRDKAAGALPGKSLVIYDPELEMATDVIPCEDGHAQERSLLNEIIGVVESRDVFVMDRNFCVNQFLFDIIDRDAFFVVRHHKQFNYETIGEEKGIGKTETGNIYEQWIQVADGQGKNHKWRKITVRLKKKTRDGDNEIVILTNLSKSGANAKVIAVLYRKRWSIETMFQELESHLHSEINTLGYPKAALFGFCVALIAYNVLATIKASLRAIHGEEKIANEVSGYYIAGELGRTYEGMNVAILPEEWASFQTMNLECFSETLFQMASNVKLSKYKKHRRGPKKAVTDKKFSKKEPHVSTAKLLG